MIVCPGTAKCGELEFANGIKISRSVRTLSISTSRQQIADFSPDLTLCQFAISALSATVFSALRLCKAVRQDGGICALAFHEPSREHALLGPVGRMVHRRAGMTSDVQIVFTPSEAESLKREGVPGRIVVIPHGTPAIERPGEESVIRVRQKFNLDDIDTVLSLGFIHRSKGIQAVIDAAPTVTRMAVKPVQFLIAGDPISRHSIFRVFSCLDWLYYRKIRRRAGHIASEASISFTGYVPAEDLPALLASVTLLAMPYRSATQSGIANYALAASVPVVASALPGLQQAFGEAAHYVSSTTPPHLGTAIADVLNSNAMRLEMIHLMDQRNGGESMVTVAEEILRAAGMS